jgi:hypothetical protein
LCGVICFFSFILLLRQISRVFTAFPVSGRLAFYAGNSWISSGGHTGRHGGFKIEFSQGLRFGWFPISTDWERSLESTSFLFSETQQFFYQRLHSFKPDATLFEWSPALQMIVANSN